MSTATAATPAAPTRPRTYGWIISPAWDLACFVLTPMVIIPAVLLAQQAYSAQQIWLVAIAFFSVGHHLPGFLRAYGDRDLFARFRWRLLIVPPVVFATAWWFASRELNGLQVIVLLWATWHGLMQTYGFMRIYDMKRGVRDATSARLDFWLCVSVFAAGTVFSGSRMFGILSALWESGGPVFGPAWVTGLRVVCGMLLTGVLAAYVWNLAVAARRPEGITWNKVLLAVSTAGIWWFCGAAFTNILIGVAMFEIYHAVQYLAIVWVFHHKSFDRWSESPGMWGAVFGHRGLVLAGYLGLIGAFGAGRYFAAGIQEQQLLVLVFSLLTTSTLLHYYFDGFIWKVREPRNQQLLAVADPAAPPPRLVPALAHVAKWGLFFIPLAALLAAEQWQSGGRDQPQRVRIAQTLAAAAPYLPDAHLIQANVWLDAGDVAAAQTAAQRAVELDPQSPEAYAVLAHTLQATAPSAGHTPDRKAQLAALREAVRLAPERAAFRYNLAGALRDSGQWQEADAEYRAALDRSEAKYKPDIQRDLESLQLDWSDALLDAGQFKAAAARLRNSPHPQAPLVAARILLHPQNKLPWARQIKWASVEGNWNGALEPLEQEFGSLSPAEICLAIGDVYLQYGREVPAKNALEQAVKLDPELAAAHHRLGTLLLERSQLSTALPTFEVDLEQRARMHLNAAKRLGFKDAGSEQ